MDKLMEENRIPTFVSGAGFGMPEPEPIRRRDRVLGGMTTGQINSDLMALKNVSTTGGTPLGECPVERPDNRAPDTNPLRRIDTGQRQRVIAIATIYHRNNFIGE
ncbi:hypothetical protein N8I71_11610 [Roseibacterium sp. SDUM158016]|uniref:hypothetical protein n=1 Tax=Roseicyclus sediminis TaxID=2980997 RepID=UPI0021D1FB81|nr:hypothetical protein [Roseibacterium sp. SDUM158016]MCU4653483.1 hypothetical protein [Roseibacterium sp. SDUM158016]